MDIGEPSMCSCLFLVLQNCFMIFFMSVLYISCKFITHYSFLYKYFKWNCLFHYIFCLVIICVQEEFYCLHVYFIFCYVTKLFYCSQLYYPFSVLSCYLKIVFPQFLCVQLSPLIQLHWLVLLIPFLNSCRDSGYPYLFFYP